MAEVTVVTPFYNSRCWIEQSVQSVIKQTYPDWELVLIDDGSTDDSVAKVEPYLKDPRIKLIRQSRSGPPAARNAALKVSRSPFIAILDSDDVWVPERLERSIAALKAQPDRDLCYSGAFDMWEDGLVFRRRIPERYADGDVLKALVDHNFVPSGTITITRRCYEAVGDFDPAVNGVDDYDFLLRAAGKFKFVALNEPLIYFRYHGTNLSLSEFVFQSRFRMLEKCLANYPALEPEVQRHRARIFYSHAIAHISRGEQSSGREKLRQAIRLDPTRFWSYYLYAKTFFLKEGRALGRKANI